MTTETQSNDSTEPNDLTRFLRETSDAERKFDDVGAANVRSWFTSSHESGCVGDDFDGGDYTGDDPVFAKVEVTIDVPNDGNATGAAADLQATLSERGFVVEDTDWSGYFSAPRAGPGQPAGGGRDAERYRVTVTGKRYIGGPEPSPDGGVPTPIENDRIVGAVARDF